MKIWQVAAGDGSRDYTEYTEYEMALKNVSCDNVYFVNISGKQVEKIKLREIS